MRILTSIPVVVLVLAMPALALAPGEDATPAAVSGLAMDVALPSGLESIVFVPADPRSADAALEAPDAAHGLWAGRTASGAPVHLVLRDGLALGVVGTLPLSWVTLSEGVLVPFTDPLPMEPIDIEVEAPEASPVSMLDGGGDGILQIFLDGDHPYVQGWGDNWDDYQLMVIHLMRVPYIVQLETDIEVIGQHAWTTPDPFTGAELCTTDPNILYQFRSHYEATDPTLASAREAAHLFTGKVLHTSIIGCAYVRQLETSWAYGVSKFATGELKPANLKRDVNLVAHELGHNFFGLHERATPTPGGLLNVAGCLGPTTIMYPCLGSGNLGVFSDGAGAADGVLETGGAMADGGNVQWMRAYAQSRV